MQKKKDFIVNFLYFGILALLTVIILKYALPMLAPFVIAFVIAYLLKRPIGFLAEKLHIGWKPAAILAVLLFYCTIGLLLALLSLRAFSACRVLLENLPAIYTGRVEPFLMGISEALEQKILNMDAALAVTIQEMWGQSVQSLGQMISSLSMGAMGAVSEAASSLPKLFVELLLQIIATFFIAADYDRLTGFCMRQLNEKTKGLFLQIKEYVVGTLFVCIRSYALIMFITFVELSIGLMVIGVENSVLIAFLIAVFDILPVLGTGGIMIPWIVITALQGNLPMAFGLLAVYLIITVIRNILEPKIVGSQLGLHPVVTLACIFVGAQLFGVIGLFGLPIGMSLLRNLNENGTLNLFKKAEVKKAEAKKDKDKKE